VAKLNRFVALHGGWHTRAVAWTAAGVLLLWASGVVLYLWPAEETFQLAAWQLLLRRAALIAHGCTVWAFCVLAGRWVWPHVVLVWDYRRGATWLLGVAAAALLGAIAASGLLLLYGTEATHAPASATHWWTAVGVPVLLALHGRGWLRRR
jgi:hypothetical protein